MRFLAKDKYSLSQPIDELISDTDEYRNWLISHVEEFTEENRVDSSSYFNAKFLNKGVNKSEKTDEIHSR